MHANGIIQDIYFNNSSYYNLHLDLIDKID